MAITTVVKIECDHCGERIYKDTEYIDATAFGGTTYHKTCWRDMTAQDLAKQLGLDEIYIGYNHKVTPRRVIEETP